jgi:hypothetical protein
MAVVVTGEPENFSLSRASREALTEMLLAKFSQGIPGGPREYRACVELCA